MRTAAIAALASASLVVSTAQAQTTNCSWVGQIWTCNQSGGLNPNVLFQHNPVADIGENYRRQTEEANRNYWLRRQAEQQARDRAVAESYAHAQQEIADYRARKAQELRQDVGKRLATGDCQGAQAAALNAGNIDLANQAQAYCAAHSSR